MFHENTSISVLHLSQEAKYDEPDANRKIRRLRKVLYWKGRRRGYTSAIEEQNEHILSRGFRGSSKKTN